MNASRFGVADAAAGAAAGASDSSHGRAMTVPRPFKAVRREIVFEFMASSLRVPETALANHRGTETQRKTQSRVLVFSLLGVLCVSVVSGLSPNRFVCPSASGRGLISQRPGQ